MNQDIKNKAISLKWLLEGAVNAFITRSELISPHSDTKFRLKFRRKVATLKTLLTIVRYRSDEWLYKNSTKIENTLESIRDWLD